MLGRIAKNASVAMQKPLVCHKMMRALSTKVAYPTIPTTSTPAEIVSAIDQYHEQSKLSTEDTFFGGLGEIIAKHGWVPFIGLGMAALMSKEIFHINTEVVVLFNTSFAVFTMYVLGSDSVIEAYKKHRAEDVSAIQAVFQAKKDILKANIECCEAIVNKPAVVGSIHKAFVEANTAVAASRALQANQTARDSVVSTLNALYVKEQAELNARRDAVRSKAQEYIIKNLKSDAVKSSILKEAISLVGATEDKTGQFAAINKLIEDAVKAAKK